MASVHPPPPGPPPPPPPCKKQPTSAYTPPTPQHAAIPIPHDVRYPIPETGGQSDAQGHPQAGGAISEEQGEAQSEDDQTCHPVQETNPAPQTYGNP